MRTVGHWLYKLAIKARSAEGLRSIIISSLENDTDAAQAYFDLNTLTMVQVKRAANQIFMESQKTLSRFPDPVTVYRGGAPLGEMTNVTTDRDTAIFFSRMYKIYRVDVYQIYHRNVYCDVSGLLAGKVKDFEEGELIVMTSGLIPVDVIQLEVPAEREPIRMWQ